MNAEQMKKLFENGESQVSFRLVGVMHYLQRQVEVTNVQTKVLERIADALERISPVPQPQPAGAQDAINLLNKQLHEMYQK